MTREESLNDGLDEQPAHVAMDVTQAIQQTLASVGLAVRVDDDGHTLRLTGTVDTPAAREAAADVAQSIAPGRHLANDLDIEEIWPPAAVTDDAMPLAVGLPMDVKQVHDAAELEPDFTAQVLETSTVTMAGEASAGIDTHQDGETVIFPPTDPVVTIGDDGRPEVLGGFAPTSMDDDTGNAVPPSALDGELGDEAIADAVRNALRRDALTTDLAITIAVREGVVHLRGAVASLDDVDSAEDVASRTPGVVQVIEELEVVGY